MLQKPFPGLRKFIGFLETGKLPMEWAGTMSGTLDMLPFVNELEYYRSVDIPVTVPGTAYPLTVPSDEYWLVRAASVTTEVIGVAQDISVAPMWQPREHTSVFPIPFFPYTRAMNTTSFQTGPLVQGSFGGVLPLILPLRPGDVAGYTVWGVDPDGTNIDIVFQLGYHKVPLS